MINLHTYLQDIEDRLDEGQEQQLYEDWVKYADGEWEGGVFCPWRKVKAPPGVPWPKVNINDALKDQDLMILREFAAVSDKLTQGDGLLLSVRCNYGVGIIPSMLGATPFIMPYEADTLPNVLHLQGGRQAIEAMIEAPIIFDNGWMKQVLEVGSKLEAIRDKYPMIGKYVRVDHPDFQGPMDLAELLWGSDIFLAFYDDKPLVHKLLRKVTDTYKMIIDRWFDLVPNRDSYHAWFGCLHQGKVTLRDDSAMNLSPEMFEEFILPYDKELLSYVGGGSIHYCGRGDHFAPYFQEMDDLRAVHMSQPEYNDLSAIVANTVGKDIPLHGLSKAGYTKMKAMGLSLNGLVHVTSVSGV